MEYSPPPLFKQGAPARVKVTVFALIAIVLLVVDARMGLLAGVRTVAATVLYPMQMAAMPRFNPRACRALSRCSTMRAPEAPTGCPSAMAPPSTFNRAWSSVPQAGVPSCSRQ